MNAAGTALLRRTATRMRDQAAALAAADTSLSAHRAEALGWLHRNADELEATADSYETRLTLATEYAGPGVLAWVTGFRERLAAAAALEDLTALGAEAAAATTDGQLPDAVAAVLQQDFKTRAVALVDAQSVAVERLQRRRNRMFALLPVVGVDLDDEDAYRGYMAEAIGRSVLSSTSLTADETELVIARLERAIAQSEPAAAEAAP
ncbi:hypothetical protein [Cryptosporangium sp. NPDC051539]|uniref:hypothetical protein n=1 Tax=Cryptosporangium sp. NPDC051539 TaxID=3363962 RepID=UPI0037BDECC2